MNYINPPKETPQNVTHNTFYSQILNHEISYNIYLPPDYGKSGKNYPIAYHIHGWQGNESSDIWAMKKTYRNREDITVFINAISSENEYFDAVNQIGYIITKELIPHIDKQYRTDTTNRSRAISGFSMGGAMAFYYALKYPELFGSVTAYAGTYHHWYRNNYDGVGEPMEKAIGLYENMMREPKYFEEDSVLYFIKQNAGKIRDNLQVKIHIGTTDPLICDNEILHLYLNSLNIPHEYILFDRVGHELDKII